jgi:hypothetical protein
VVAMNILTNISYAATRERITTAVGAGSTGDGCRR